MNRSFDIAVSMVLLLVFIFNVGCASTPKESTTIKTSTVSSGDTSISAQGAIGKLDITDSPRFEGNGGSDIRLAILAPELKGDVPQYLPLHVQGLLNNNFKNFSSITLIDRENLDRIIAEQKIATGSMNYSDQDYINMGELVNARYLLLGTIQSLSEGHYSLQLSITEFNTGIRKAYTIKDGVLAQFEGTGAVINAATADLLDQMGVRLTNTGRQTLLAGNRAETWAEAFNARGLGAESTGQEVTAFLNFSQSMTFNPSQLEALARFSSLSSTISSGSIGERIVNDIQARNNWLQAFRETAGFFKAHPPFEIIFDPNLVQIGETDYTPGKETANLGMRIALNPSETAFRALNTLIEGLDSTQRRSVWGFDGWPLHDTNPKTNGTVVLRETDSFSYEIDIELLNEANKALGRSVVTLNTGGITFSYGNSSVMVPAGVLKTVHFDKVKAADLTPTLNIVIVSVNGVSSRDLSASGFMRIDTGDLQAQETAQQAQEMTQHAQEVALQAQKAAKTRENLKKAGAYLFGAALVAGLITWLVIHPPKSTNTQTD